MGLKEWICLNDSSNVKMRKIGIGEKNLLLLHGFGPATEMQWKDLVEYLYIDFTLYIPDLIYFGESISDSENYDPRFISRQIFKCLKNENLKDLYVAGISFGGLIGSIYASEYNESVQGLILIGALSKFFNRQYSDSLAKANGYNSINEILIPSDGKSLKKLFELSFYKSKRYPSWILNKPAEVLYSNQRDEEDELLNFLIEHEEEMKSWDYSYTGNVQIIWGQEDRIIPVNNAYSLDKYYNNSQLTVLPNVGHVVNIERPTEVGEIIKSMLCCKIRSY